MESRERVVGARGAQELAEGSGLLDLAHRALKKGGGLVRTERREGPIEIPGISAAFDELAQLFEQESRAIVTDDLDGHLTYCNPAFSRLTGYERESELGTTPPLPWWSPEFPRQSPEEARLAMHLYQTVILKLVREAGVFTHPGVMYPKEGWGSRRRSRFVAWPPSRESS